MVSRKIGGQPVSKVSSAAAPALSSSTRSANKSAITRSAFSPSWFQLSLFASVIPGLESDQLRIHDSISGRLKCEHAIGSRARITCLEWGHYSLPGRDPAQQSSQKKRKRSEEANGLSGHHKDAVVALGTSHSEIHMYLPTEGRVIGVLKEGHTQGIRDFKFVDDATTSLAWSLGGDGKLKQWNLRNGAILKTLSTPMISASTILLLQSRILCASHTIHHVDPNLPEETFYVGELTDPISSMIAGPTQQSKNSSSFLASADSNRSVFLFDIPSRSILGSLVALDDIESMTLYREHEHDSSQRPTKQPLAAVTRKGEVAFFQSPFDVASPSESNALASLKLSKGTKPQQTTALIKVKRQDKNTTPVFILSAAFENNDIVVALGDGGLHLSFDRVPWRDASTGETILIGPHELATTRSSATNGIGKMNGVKAVAQNYVDESHTVVSKGDYADAAAEIEQAPEIIQISSGEEEESDSEEDQDADHGQPVPQPEVPAHGLMNGALIVKEDVTMRDAVSDGGEDAGDVEEPTFGDLIRANAPEVIDVGATFPDSAKQILVPLSEGAVKLPTGLSLGAVLTQSLRTNDVNLLETCFHTQNLDIIRATIERLESPLAITLLQKLAERLHSRPGRAGSLMVWIQWTLVAHGGYLAGQPEVVKKLRSLHQVVKERANSLQPLLSLKGKLDMLEAQMNLRKSMQSRFGAPNTGIEDDEGAVIYVEGQAESSSDDDLAIEDAADIAPSRIKIQKRIAQGLNEESSDSDKDMIDMPISSEEEEVGSNSGGESDEAGLVDDEALESDGSTEGGQSEDEIDHEDMDSLEEDDESEEEPSTRQAAEAGLSNGSLERMT